jgi:hypothetical protein
VVLEKEFRWADRVKNEVLHRVMEELNILRTMKRIKAKWIGHILRRICYLKYVIGRRIEGRLKVKGRRGRRRKQLLANLKETRGHWKLIALSVENSLWEMLWTCLKMYCRMNETASFSI